HPCYQGICRMTSLSWKSLITKNKDVMNKAINFYAMDGYLGLIQWGYNNGCYWNKETSRIAAEKGHLPILQWLKDDGYYLEKEENYIISYLAALAGHISILKWLCSNGFYPYNA